MDKFNEELVAETVPVLVRVLGLPRDLAERAVRHAFSCREDPCPVNLFLLDRVNAATARLTGVPKSQVAEAVTTSVKAANDTLAMQHKLGLKIDYEQLRTAYGNGGTTLDLTMGILMEKP